MSTPVGVRGPDGPPVRTSVVGLGWAAKSIWLPRLRQHPAFAVASVVDPNPAARAEIPQDRAGTRLLDDVAELSRDGTDLAVVAVPNHLHSTVACRLLRMGIPVFLEKPVCLNSAEAEQLAAAERAGGTVLLAGSAARYRADVTALRRVVRQDLGELRHVELSWVRARGVPDAGGWFTQRQFAGGGALVDLGWHLLDTVGPILGPVGFDQAVGTVSDDFVNDRSSQAAWREDAPKDAGSDGDVEDTARGFLVTEDGVSVAIRASWASHEPYDVTRIRVDGSAGSATLTCTFGFSPNRRKGSSLVRVRDGVETEVPLPEEEIGAEYLQQLDELPGLLADPASQGRTVDEVRRTIAVIERIYRSARRARIGARSTRAARPVPYSTLLNTEDHHA
ncbi:Gfo/Idh/MocA family protein [Streptomyces chryseus]|uniref:Oxidoreductase n=1 Tax=Streptomyces chryseus TaxID=68186 RepID=A0ABQ3DF11_9ACTN|nr:oxidoreductase [Streptomyces chryseus]